MASIQKQIPIFFKCINDEDRTKKLDLPKSWCSYMGRSLPCEVVLRNRFGDSWEVKISHYQNTGVLLFDEHDDEKEYVRIRSWEKEKRKEQLDGMETEHVFPEFESTLGLGERGNMHHEPVELESEPQLQPQSEERKQQTDPKEQQEWSPAIKEEDEEAVFQSGFPRPKNPYFVTKRRCKRNELYVAAEVVKDFNLIFPEEIEIHDERGRRWAAKVCKWKDGRLWISKGWRAFCKWNLVQRDDWCINEIIRPEAPAALFNYSHIITALLQYTAKIYILPLHQKQLVN
ncbi:hypothetical protein POM88_014129 [Heracleum sosnowskyi]|uniref:TF-B3 domain-containing protein n=1 Tax=Heracleum sosnowskyi TaxID=360622 RepID=A0AAD8N518_9APIA|nr:hypothetical protein POM88_014129 [Heracleum sosnowskyi]